MGRGAFIRVSMSMSIVFSGLAGATAGVAAATTPPPGASAVGSGGGVPTAVGGGAPDQSLPPGWQSSSDLAVTTSGDATGLHLLAARGRERYRWKALASLAVPGIQTDEWIGNTCVTGSGRWAAVAYAPRSFTNKPELMERGAFTAIVDLATGAVTDLPMTATLAYFSPGCGVGDDVVFTESANEGAHSRLLTVDARDKRVTGDVTVDDQVTSAVPGPGGTMLAAESGRLISISRAGVTTPVAKTESTPFQIRADRSGGAAYLTFHGEQATAWSVLSGHPRPFATGSLGSLALASGSDGHAFLTGTATLTGPLPATIRQLAVPADARPSDHGDVAAVSAVPERYRTHGIPSGTTPLDSAGPITVTTVVPSTGKSWDAAVEPTRDGRQPATAPSSLSHQAAPHDVVSDPSDGANRYCAVPRNDVKTQVYQPTPNQVEWAANEAVQGALDISRPANWKGSGLPAWSPRQLFPPGDVRVPAQVFLGVMAQESNLWQATGHAIPGEYGNPLIANYYGNDFYHVTPETKDHIWDVHFDKADCGYGVGQATDGMRVHGREKKGELRRLSTLQQRAVAVDYATNISFALQILQSKWDELHKPGQTIQLNNDDPAKPENWFAALWNYNEGFNPPSSEHPGWGLGWLNNPANAIYPPGRDPFLTRTYRDASHPQDWSYEEKVMGWGASPIDTGFSFNDNGDQQHKGDKGYDTHGYSYDWWKTAHNRDLAVKPLLSTFCKPSSNGCDTENPPTTDCKKDLKCWTARWFHDRTGWQDYEHGECGHERIRYKPGHGEPGDSRANAPDCSTRGLPSGSLVVDTAPGASFRPDCAKTWREAGGFDLAFPRMDDDTFPAKIDLEQVSDGFGGHLWFAHARTPGNWNGKMSVTGTWHLNRSMTGWGRVLVHVPFTAARTQQAAYTIRTGKVTETRVIQQYTRRNEWVSLGVFPFNGVPSVSLSNADDHGLAYVPGEQGPDPDKGKTVMDIAWDSVAFQPLPGKPRDIVVAMGDSYTSGEGASSTDGKDYYPETNADGRKDDVNGCHQSPFAWPRKGVLADHPDRNLGARADSLDNDTDFHLIACSGSFTQQLLPSPERARVGEPSFNTFNWPGQGMYWEQSQIDEGYLDDNTTLVTFSISGNDANFVPIMQSCIEKGLIRIDCVDPGEEKSITGGVISSAALALQVIHMRAPNAKIIWMGYPILLSKNANCVIGLQNIPGSVRWMNEMTKLLDDRIRDLVAQQAASGVPVSFADPRPAFTGRAVCDEPAHLNGIVFTLSDADTTPIRIKGKGLASQQSFHPNEQGSSDYAGVFDRALRAIGW